MLTVKLFINVNGKVTLTFNLEQSFVVIFTVLYLSGWFDDTNYSKCKNNYIKFKCEVETGRNQQDVRR